MVVVVDGEKGGDWRRTCREEVSKWITTITQKCTQLWIGCNCWTQSCIVIFVVVVGVGNEK